MVGLAATSLEGFYGRVRDQDGLDNPYPQRTHVLRLLGQKTLVCKASILMLRVRVYCRVQGKGFSGERLGFGV